MHSVKEEVWLQLALQRLQSDFRQLCFELCRTKFSLPIPAVIQKRMCDEHNRNVGAGYVVHDTSQKHAFENAPWSPEGMDMGIPNSRSPLAIFRIPVTIRSHTSQRDMRKGKDESSGQMEQRSLFPIATLKREPKCKRENERGERSISEDLAKFHARNHRQACAAADPTIQLVNSGDGS